MNPEDPYSFFYIFSLKLSLPTSHGSNKSSYSHQPVSLSIVTTLSYVGVPLHVSLSSSRSLGNLGQVCNPSGIIPSRLKEVPFDTRSERVPFVHKAKRNQQSVFSDGKICPVKSLRLLASVWSITPDIWAANETPFTLTSQCQLIVTLHNPRYWHAKWTINCFVQDFGTSAYDTCQLP